MTEFIQDIKETVEGYPVKNLKWNQMDNIIVGQVKCPVLGRESFNEGFIVCQWRRNGTPTNRFKGRDDLKITLDYGKEDTI